MTLLVLDYDQFRALRGAYDSGGSTRCCYPDHETPVTCPCTRHSCPSKRRRHAESGSNDSEPDIPKLSALGDAHEVLLGEDLGGREGSITAGGTLAQTLDDVPDAHGDGEMLDLGAGLKEARIKAEVVRGLVASVEVVINCLDSVASEVSCKEDTIEKGHHLFAAPLAAYNKLGLLDVDERGEGKLALVGKADRGQEERRAAGRDVADGAMCAQNSTELAIGLQHMVVYAVADLVRKLKKLPEQWLDLANLDMEASGGGGGIGLHDL